ncbi:MAG: two component regulator propeller domain protein, partial [Chloroflexi bacterium]|nr:two component regulator propeller domain protein [Chloroflexota bacterium]
DIVGVSHDEAWALDGSATGEGRIWHYADGGWSLDEVVSLTRAYPGRLALTPAGDLVVATGDGAAIRRGGQWTVLESGPVSAVAPAPDGTVWLAGPTDWNGLGKIRNLRLDGSVEVGSVPDPPEWPGWAADSLAVGADGSLWAGLSRLYNSPAEASGFGLYRYADGRWERLLAAALDRPEERGVSALATAPNGDLWVAWQGTQDAEGTMAPGTVARYDGSRWTLFGKADGVPDGYPSTIAVGPDGTIWVATDPGLARFDGIRWAVDGRWDFGGPASVAPDGTVFAVGPSGLARIADPGH